MIKKITTKEIIEQLNISNNPFQEDLSTEWICLDELKKELVTLDNMLFEELGNVQFDKVCDICDKWFNNYLCNSQEQKVIESPKKATSSVSCEHNTGEDEVKYSQGNTVETPPSSPVHFKAFFSNERMRERWTVEEDELLRKNLDMKTSKLSVLFSKLKLGYCFTCNKLLHFKYKKFCKVEEERK